MVQTEVTGKMELCLPFLMTGLLFLITSVMGFDSFLLSKGPNVRQRKQYVSRPYSSLKEECTKSRRIVEHCHRGKEGIMQYTECDVTANDKRPTLRVIKCVYPKTKCVEKYQYHAKTYAQCVDSGKKPSFPKTGTISWNGTVVYDPTTYWYRPRPEPVKRTAPVYGKVWLDDKGNFYRKEKKVDKWPGKGVMNHDNKEPAILKSVFTILNAAENGQFIGYEGFANKMTHQCKNGIFDRSYDSLSLLWKQRRWNSRFKLHSRKRLDAATWMETWVERIKGEESDSVVTWMMKYYVKTGFAVPVSMELVYDDDYNGRETERYEYHYKPLGEDDKTIEVPDYC